MAFNFNWSPLTADADFYQRARDLLTAALNKSPKPPIIVDDILVTEFNLGSVPPDLEILEIGDLAEDRFRGIFKMCYSGDAFVTLRTRVQANPLNTYLFSKPTFTSPQPLAAASGLTIPISITLSEIKLSAFIILVFSKQKGITVVFRNDPLESLKVSSTFDSIQFVREYLQRTIEAQLRTLMMDELPTIIHRLSLQLWCPDQLPKENEERADGEPIADPLSSPPMDPVDLHGHMIDQEDISALSLEGGGPELQSLFSLRNLLRLSSLTDAQTTISIVTREVRDMACRSLSGAMEGLGSTYHSPPTATPTLAKSNSFIGTATGHSTTYTFSDSGSSTHGHLPSRPSLVSLNSASTGLSLGSGMRSRSYQGKKKKKRVVNLRKAKSEDGGSEAGETISAATSETASVIDSTSEALMESSIPEEPEEPTQVPMPTTPKVRFSADGNASRTTPRPQLSAETYNPPSSPSATSAARLPEVRATVEFPEPSPCPVEKVGTRSQEKAPIRTEKSQAGSDTSSVILEQAWIMKMAGEIARRVYEEKRRHPEGIWDEREETPPPAYSTS
jgi:distribution and morphology protein 34